jgi:hypothetical protein
MLFLLFLHCRFPREKAKAAPQSTAAGRASPPRTVSPQAKPHNGFAVAPSRNEEPPPLLRFRSTEGQILKLFAVALSLQ